MLGLFAISSRATRHTRTVILAAATLVACVLAPGFSSAASAHGHHRHSATAHSTRAAAARMADESRPAYFARQMLRLLNAERRAHGLRPLSMDADLVASARRHNHAMADDNTMSHRLPDEAPFTRRIEHTGYNWLSAGENVGYHSRRSLAALRQLQRRMYQEKAPDDGHRRNILDRSYRQVGIDVYFDAQHHRMWFTQDFGQPR